ncbi:hypothetical protein DFH09DRAFT_1067825 [Mycena vulgaris]|nr:hypothetical protein DFH09DRAFT_1079706 [Mycena vulgaris]KAJ6605572.1 hypothetical protein DFH09DRAFT_1067825 [Mycena vulgaris]
MPKLADASTGSGGTPRRSIQFSSGSVKDWLRYREFFENVPKQEILIRAFDTAIGCNVIQVDLPSRDFGSNKSQRHHDAMFDRSNIPKNMQGWISKRVKSNSIDLSCGNTSGAGAGNQVHAHTQLESLKLVLRSAEPGRRSTVIKDAMM